MYKGKKILEMIESVTKIKRIILRQVVNVPNKGGVEMAVSVDAVADDLFKMAAALFHPEEARDRNDLIGHCNM